MPKPTRPWWAIDLPAVLVACLFVLTIEAFAAVVYYRQQLALIPDAGRAVAQCPDETPCTPPTRETPETLP